MHVTARQAPPQRVRGEEGSVTAETAATIPALLLVLVMCVSLVATIHAQLRCVDAARAAARLAARGEAQDDVVAAATRLGPSGAAVSVRRQGPVVVVAVKATARPLTRFLPGIPVKAEASVEAEDR